MIEREVSRCEDMSIRGKLVLYVQDDGDIIVAVHEPYFDDIRVAAVEFCIPGTGGGDSPETHRALRDLMEAMTADNEERTVKSDIPLLALREILEFIEDKDTEHEVFGASLRVEEWLLRYKNNA